MREFNVAGDAEVWTIVLIQIMYKQKCLPNYVIQLYIILYVTGEVLTL